MTTAAAMRRKPIAKLKAVRPPRSVPLIDHASIPRPNASRFMALPMKERLRIIQEGKKALGPFVPSVEEFRAEQRRESESD